MVDPDMGTWNYSADSLNELLSWTDASQSFSAGYDLLGRLIANKDQPRGDQHLDLGKFAEFA